MASLKCRLGVQAVCGTSDANIPFPQFCHLLRRLGFEERIRGDHHIFTKDGKNGGRCDISGFLMICSQGKENASLLLSQRASSAAVWMTSHIHKITELPQICDKA